MSLPRAADVTALPSGSDLRGPVLQALLRQGGEASNAELEDAVVCDLALTDEQRPAPHNAARGKRAEFVYRLAWARTKLSSDGLVLRCGQERRAFTKAGREAAEKDATA